MVLHQQKNQKQGACPQVQIHFTRWSRKRYAIFSSLGKQVKIGVLSLSFSMLCLSQSSFASVSMVGPTYADVDDSPDVTDTIELSPAIVQAPAQPLASELSRVVLSIEYPELQRSAVQNIQDVLSLVSSIDLRQRGPQGVQADISIRGGNFDQVLILINGVNFTDPQTGHHNLNIPIDLSQVERIEILQGPGARVLGPNAFSGAINIITKSSDLSSAQLAMTLGQHKLQDISGSGQLALKKFSVHAAVNHKSSEGYTENTDFDIKNAFLHARFKDDKAGEIYWQSGYQDKAFGANAYYSTTYPHQFEQVRTFINSLGYKKNYQQFSGQANVYHRRSFDRFELFRSQPASWYSGHNYHKSDVVGGNIKGEYRYFPWKTTAGADMRYEHIFSNVLGDRQDEPRRVPFEKDSVFYTHASARKITNWFAEQSYYSKIFSLSVGLMGSYSKDYGHFTCLGADFVGFLTSKTSLFASVNQAIRIPTFTDLYYTSAVQLGNRDLKPERSTTFELGSKYKANLFSSSLSVFYRRSNNTIDWVRQPGEEMYKVQNHILIQTLGVDVDAVYRPDFPFFKGWRQIKLSYANLNMDKVNKGVESSRVLDYLSHKMVLSTQITVWKSLDLSLAYRLEQRAGEYIDFSTRQPTSFRPEHLFDLKVLWSKPYYSLFVEVSNLFNQRYYDFVNLPMPGRWVQVGMSLKWQQKAKVS